VPAANCAPSGHTEELESAAANDFALSRRLDFTSCGQHLRKESPCCATMTEGYDCLVDALATCSPARLGEFYGTVEGAAIFTDYFVVPLDDGCELVELIDNGEDSFRATTEPAVSTRHCGLARTRAALGADTCPIFDLSACRQ